MTVPFNDGCNICFRDLLVLAGTITTLQHAIRLVRQDELDLQVTEGTVGAPKFVIFEEFPFPIGLEAHHTFLKLSLWE